MNTPDNVVILPGIDAFFFDRRSCAHTYEWITFGRGQLALRRLAEKMDDFSD